MKPKGLRAILLALPLFLIAASQGDEEPEYRPGEYVVVCPIEGMIDDGVLILVQRALREGRDAAAIIFEVNTPGGLVDAAVEISSAIVESPVPTIAYIHDMGAISAGAIISYACDDMVMAPGTNMGAATPIQMSPGGAMPVGEKVVSFVRGKIRSLAEENGHNPDIAEAMVDSDVQLTAWPNPEGGLIVRATDRRPEDPDAEADGEEETANEAARLLRDILEAMDQEVPLPEDVKEGVRSLAEEQGAKGTAPEIVDELLDVEGKVVLEKGKLLTLTTEDAKKWGVIPISAAHISEVLSFFGFGGLPELRIVPTWSEDLFRWLTSPTVSGLLLMLGIGGLYFEVRTPGFGLPGIVGATCLGLFFGARAVIGLAEWLDLLLVVVGIGLILVEVLLLPGFGLAGAAGTVSLIIGIYLSFTRVPIPEYAWDFQRLQDMTISLGVFALGFTAMAFLITKLFPRTPFYNRLVLADAQEVDLGYVVQTEEQESMVGAKGVATSMLRPAGRGRFDDKTLSVVSRADFIDSGTPIVIVQVEGNRYVVDPVKEDSGE